MKHNREWENPCCEIDEGGKITFSIKETTRKYVRNRNNIKKFNSALNIDAGSLSLF